MLVEFLLLGLCLDELFVQATWGSGLHLRFQYKMSLCFQSFNHLSNMNCYMSKHTSQSQQKKNPSLMKVPLLIVPQSEGTNDPAEKHRSSMLRKPSADGNSSIPLRNCVGIIGGVSVDSTLNFIKQLSNLSSGESSSFVLSSDPAVNKQLLLLETNSFPSSAVEILRQQRVFLENSGVSCIVMPCHVLHSWYDEVVDGCSVPFFHAGKCVAKELKASNLRPLEAGSSIRIGVIATNGTSVARLYQEKLEDEGFEVLLHDKATEEHIVIPSVEALKQKDFEGAQNLFRIALQVLLIRAVNKIVVASDELRELLPPDDPLWKKCVYPMDSLARSCLKSIR